MKKITTNSVLSKNLLAVVSKFVISDNTVQYFHVNQSKCYSLTYIKRKIIEFCIIIIFINDATSMSLDSEKHFNMYKQI